MFLFKSEILFEGERKDLDESLTTRKERPFLKQEDRRGTGCEDLDMTHVMNCLQFLLKAWMKMHFINK